MENNMKELDSELLSRYLDGELPASEAQALRKRLLAEPELRQQFDQLRKVDQAVKVAFSQPGIDAVPAQVAHMVENAPVRRSTGRRQLGLAVAASLVAAAGLLLSNGWQQSQQQFPGSDAQLAELLETTPSRATQWDALPDGRQVRPLLSFRSNTGTWCREFLVADAGAASRGVACREAGNWQTVVLSPAQLPMSADDYRPAGAAQADDVAAFINHNAADIPLSPQQEAELISRRWQ